MSISNVTPYLINFFLGLLLSAIAIAVICLLSLPIGFYGMALYIEPTLPSLTEIKTATKEMPLQIYSKDNLLIAQFGSRMSLPVEYDDIPDGMIHAFLAAEDASFYEHTGISVKGLGRAITEVVSEKGTQTGGSTITMQVAKNYFLSSNKTYKRKLTELYLSRKIEGQLTKEEIMTLYVNKIYLGEGAYGIQAAAKRYYSKTLDHLTIAETAMLAGLPKAPSKFNPVKNPERALVRRNWILGRMLSLGHITQSEYDTAVLSPNQLNMYNDSVDVEFPYLTEMARYSLVEQYGSEVMNSGWRIRLTVDSDMQNAADRIVREHLLRYDDVYGKGWRGAEANNEPLFYFHTAHGNLHPAKVIKIEEHSFDALMKDGKTVTVPWSGISWARPYLSAGRTGNRPKTTSDVVNLYDIIRIKPDGQSWRLAQAPKIQGSLVSINPKNGAIISLVGGYDYYTSNFNRAIQGWRQPGSTIKPLIYSAALEKGFTPNSLIADSPLKIGDWRPKNSDGRYYGPIPLRKALYLSRNLVSIRLLRSIGMANARSLLDQFGLDKEKLPSTLSLALGAGQASPLQMATAYSAFANGGHRIQPFLIDQIYSFENNLLYQSNPDLSCAKCHNQKIDEGKEINSNAFSDNEKPNDEKSFKEMTDQELEELLHASSNQSHPDSLSNKNLSPNNETNDAKTTSNKEIDSPSNEPYSVNGGPEVDRLKISATQHTHANQAHRILSPSVAFDMAEILKDVVQRGTATRAKSLGRSDIGGKTGTTNNFKDAWFAGFHPSNVTVVWMGFDQPASLGNRMYGGRLALPVWIDYMRLQLQGKPNEWVTLENDANSIKETHNTVDITDKEKNIKPNNGEYKNKLPTGVPYKRKPTRRYWSKPSPVTSTSKSMYNSYPKKNKVYDNRKPVKEFSTNFTGKDIASRPATKQSLGSAPMKELTNGTTNYNLQKTKTNNSLLGENGFITYTPAATQPPKVGLEEAKPSYAERPNVVETYDFDKDSNSTYNEISSIESNSNDY